MVAADEAVDILSAIAEQIQDIAERNQDMATATNDQTNAVQKIHENIQHIDTINKTSAETANGLVAASSELDQLSSCLDSMVGSFKI